MVKLDKNAIEAIENILRNGYEAIVKTEKGSPVVIETIRKVKYKESVKAK